MKVLDLFSGIGGFSLGLESAGMETIAFCEIEKYPQKVLAKHWPDIPIAQDVTKLTYKDGVLYDDGKEIYRGAVDLICGGFPCQDISLAGNQKGIGEGTRSGLWSECARLLREVRPSYAIFENVTALLSGEQGRWFQRVLFDISEVGYDAEWHCIPASARGVDAPHQRDRVWIVAYPLCRRSEVGGEYKSNESSSGKGYIITQRSGANDRREFNSETNEVVAYPDNTRYTTHRNDSNGNGQTIKQERQEQSQPELSGCGWWEIEPQLGRVANGIPDRSHRLKCLGNAVVPQIPEIIGKAIMESNL